MIIPFIIAAFVIIADQVSKYIVKTNMNLGESFPLIKYIFNITYIENDGAAWNILSDHRWIFMVFSSIALILMGAAIIYLGRKNIRKDNFLINIALAFMLGGGIGNMIDRFANVTVNPIREEGTKVVVDFIQFDFFKQFPVFNIADSFICIGSVLFCILIFIGKYKLKDTEKASPEIKPEEINPEDNL